MHELHDQHGFTDSGATEQPGFTPFDKGAQQVNDLDPGLQHLTYTYRLLQRKWTAMDIAELPGYQGIAIIQRLAEDIQQAPQAFGRYRNMQRRPCVINSHTPVQTGASVQGKGAHMLLVEVLMDFEQVGLVIEPGTQGLSQRWQRIAGDDGYRAVDLRNHTNW
jgi:hypothetical protein